jgi:hypothetical protein
MLKVFPMTRHGRTWKEQDRPDIVRLVADTSMSQVSSAIDELRQDNHDGGRHSP